MIACWMLTTRLIPHTDTHTLFLLDCVNLSLWFSLSLKNTCSHSVSILSTITTTTIKTALFWFWWWCIQPTLHNNITCLPANRLTHFYFFLKWTGINKENKITKMIITTACTPSARPHHLHQPHHHHLASKTNSSSSFFHPRGFLSCRWCWWIWMILW